MIRPIQSMKDHGCQNFVYSSSATVYGEPETIPIPETSPLQPHSPYAKTKVFCEYILMDLAKGESDGTRADRGRHRLQRILIRAILVGIIIADSDFNICSLRYFK